MLKNNKILFISHQASRSGAPILLLHFIEGLKRKLKNVEIDIIIPIDGPIKNRFEALGRVLIINEGKPDSIIFKLLNKVSNNNLLEYKIEKKIERFLAPKYDFVFSNTISNGEVLKHVHKHADSVVTYIHELEFTINNFVPVSEVNKTLELSNHIFVPTQVVADNLIQNHNVKVADINILRYYIPDVEIKSDKNNKDKDGFIIGSSGSSGWRKGFDVFFQLAVTLKEKRDSLNLKFLWIGVDKDSIDFKMVWHDIVKAGIERYFIFIEQTDDVYKYIEQIDVFVMLSREDPYPVAVLEAAQNRKPILCFEKSGGAPDFLMGDIGITVPYMDINKMASEIILLLNDKERMLAYGQKGFDKLKELHCETNTLDVLIKFFTNNGC